MKSINRLFSRFIIYYFTLKAFFLKKIISVDSLCRVLKKCPRQCIPPVLRIGGAFIGEKVNFKDGLTIDNASGDKDSTMDLSNLYIGHNCYIGKEVFFDLPDRVEIHNECVVSARVMFLSHQDCGNRMMAKWYPRRTEKVVIGEGTWIGSGAIILSGVTLGKCCVVAAGSLVNKSFPDFNVIAGSPAKLIKILDEKEYNREI